MQFQLVRLSFERYAREVLPQTFDLWGGSHTFEAYVERNRRMAESAYGRKHFAPVIFSDDGQTVLATFKRYEREARLEQTRLRALGIGAVFTPEKRRGEGNATAMLALALDEARAAGVDFAFLFSDIHPQFYRQLGFVEMPSRSISMRSDSLDGSRVTIARIESKNWTAIRSCFDKTDARRTFALARTPLFWSHIRLRAQDSDNFCIIDGARVRAYCIGWREPKLDAYVVNEIAIDPAEEKTLGEALLRASAGDLGRVTGWLPPLPARGILPRGAVRPRTAPKLMMAPLSAAGKSFIAAASARSSGDPVWIADHV